MYADVGFRVPDDSDPRAKKPKSDDPDYATKLALHNAFHLERDVWTELKAVRKTSPRLSLQSPRPTGQTSSATSRSTGRTSTSDASTRLTPLRVIPCMTPHSGSLGTRHWSSPQEKQFKVMGVGSFTSTFGKKAHADLISYENLRAKRAREIDELYTRPFEDIVVEEFISNLPGPTIEELDVPMEQAGGSADAAPADSPSGEMAGVEEAKREPDSAPADSPSGEMAGVEEAKQEPDSATPMDVDVPMDTDVPWRGA